MEWIKTIDKLPTSHVGEQVDVIMWSPGWATWIKGLMTYWPDKPEWGQYNNYTDRFEDMCDPYPEYWCTVILPFLKEDLQPYDILQLGEHPDGSYIEDPITDAVSQYNIGYKYLRGTGGFEKDYVKASEWFRKSAAQGDIYAKNALRLVYIDTEHEHFA